VNKGEVKKMTSMTVPLLKGKGSSNLMQKLGEVSNDGCRDPKGPNRGESKKAKMKEKNGRNYQSNNGG